MMMKICALCGSLREPSSTAYALKRALKGAAAAGAEVELVELRSFELPFCDGRRDESSYGGDTAAFRASILAADGLLIGSPEYHGSFTGALKNALDLLGPDDLLQGKVVGLLSTARQDAGSMNTLSHLRHVMRWTKAWVLPTQVSIPRAQEAFGPTGAVLRDGLDEELRQLGSELVRYTGLLGS
jgi:NAD(P)H-dependent FMN reductase